MTREHNQQRGADGDKGRERPPDDLPNPTANASLTDPGSAPASAGAGSARASAGSSGQGARQAEATTGSAPPSLRPPANLPELKEEATPASGASGKAAARTMAAPRQSAGAADRDESGLIPEIPWDPTGKIDDEVERRTLGSPKGGGTNQQTEDTGPGRYGGETGERTAPQAGASTLGSQSADSADHQQRQAGAGNSGLIPEIPWDPTGKIDDEVERRTLGSPKGGGTSRQSEDTGPGRYGGETDEPVSPNRYAGASDDAPTSPSAGATTTLASLTADSAGHEPRLGASGGPASAVETWQGGKASQEAMQAGQELGNASAHRSNPSAWNDPTQGSTSSEQRRVEQYGGGGGSGEVF